MDNVIKKNLHDINESVDSINEFIGEKFDFHQYLANKMVRRAVEREFEIIGEAMTRINKINPELQISTKK